MKTYYVYILTNRSMTLYVGVTNDLDYRFQQHQTGVGSAFTRKYKLNVLVYYEDTNDINAAIAREKQIKKWSRAKKIALIESMNPNWLDLSTTLEMTSVVEMKS